jgi:pimeloyl-ACP methyl ester carboxylesterase
MKFYESGKDNAKSILFIPGNLMSWRQFRETMYLLDDTFHVIIVGLDGFDESEDTEFESFHLEADKICDWIKENLGGKLDILFGESVNMGIGISMTRHRDVRIRHFIMNGPQWLDYGLFNYNYRLYARSQKHILKRLNEGHHSGKLPIYMKYFIRRNRKEGGRMLRSYCLTASYRSIFRADMEAWKMFQIIPCCLPITTTKAHIWYGAKEPNIHRSVKRLTRLYPNWERHAFPNFGHGESVDNPELLTKWIRKMAKEEGILE